MTGEKIMKRCEELDPIWQAMKEGKKFKFENGICGYIDSIDMMDVNGDYFHGMGAWYSHAEPIEPTYRVKDPVSLMQALVDGGYKCYEDGHWLNVEGVNCFNGFMFEDCGKLVTKSKYKWQPEWLEEVYE